MRRLLLLLPLLKSCTSRPPKSNFVKNIRMFNHFQGTVLFGNSSLKKKKKAFIFSKDPFIFAYSVFSLEELYVIYKKCWEYFDLQSLKYTYLMPAADNITETWMSMGMCLDECSALLSWLLLSCAKICELS